MIKPRRWPYITTSIIVVCLLSFLLTHRQLQQEADQYAKIESRTLILVAAHPQLPVTPAQKILIDAFQNSHPQEWQVMSSVPGSSASPDETKAELAGLGQQLDDFEHDSLTARLAVYPPHRSALSNLTANFLHRDWAQLIFNMCFLWLVAGTLEDIWGRGIFGGIAIVCALLAPWAYSVVYPNTLIPLIGASGLVAGLMGAYVIRFPKTTIARGTAMWFVRPRLLRFSSPVYVVFPMWVLGLIFWGRSAGETTSDAYWAQGHAFAIGVSLGLVLWVTGLENYVTESIDAAEFWSVDAHIARASEHLEKGDLDSAINEVNLQIAEKPSSVEAHEMLASLYFRKGNALIKYLQSLEVLCEVHLSAGNPEAAWQDYENYCKAGGRKVPAATWLQLARFAENQGDWERAASEYEELARSWPDDRASVLALISAGRIQLRQFGRGEEAKRLYIAAQSSPVPHADWDEVIRKGLEMVNGGPTPKAESLSSGRRPPQ